MTCSNFNIYSEGDIDYGSDDGDLDDYDDGVTPGVYEQMIKSVRKLTKTAERNMYANANGTFTYTTVPGQNVQSYTLNIRNSSDAVLFAKMILKPSSVDITKINAGHLKMLNILKHSGGGYRVYLFFSREFAEWFSPAVKGKVRNPKTNRMIKIDNRTAKKIFKNIVLKSVVYNLLPNIHVNNYEVKKYCVISFFETQEIDLGKKRYKLLMELLKKNKTPTVDKLNCILQELNVSHSFNDYYGDCLIKFNGATKKNYTFIAHNSHLYVADGRFINKTKELVELDEKQYWETYLHFSDYDKLDDTGESFTIFGTKYVMKKDKFPEEFKMLEFQNTYTMINVKFFEGCGIRPRMICNKGTKGTTLDINNAYPGTMTNNKRCIIVQTGNEWVDKYKGEEIVDHFFYKLKESLYPFYCDWIPGFALNRFNWKCVVTHVLKGTTWVYGKKLEFKLSEYYKELKEDYEDERPGKKFENNLYRLYSGMCARHINIDSKKASISCQVECDYFSEKYSKEVTFGKDDMKINKPYFKQTTGYFAYLSIISHTINDLNQLYIDAQKKNGPLKIMRMYTDSITFNKHIDINFKSSVPFKEETHKKHEFDGMINEKGKFDFKMYMKKQHNEVTSIKEEGLIIGMPGLGKSHYCKNDLMKLYPDMLMSSSTKENAKSWNTLNIHQYMKKSDGFTRILKDLKNVKIICIDEASQLTKHTIFMLEYIKETLGIKFILIGDPNQCPASDGDNMEGHFMKRLTGYQVKEFKKWHKNCRFTKEFFNFLVKFLKLEETTERRKFLLNSKINKVKESKTKINICYNNKANPNMVEFYKKYPEAQTVHISQGKTIKENYTIHQIFKMEHRVAYTALSRASGFENVSIIV